MHGFQTSTLLEVRESVVIFVQGITVIVYTAACWHFLCSRRADDHCPSHDGAQPLIIITIILFVCSQNGAIPPEQRLLSKVIVCHYPLNNSTRRR